MKLKNIWSLFVIALLASCGREEGPTHLPVQNQKDGQWGMVTTDGEVVFEDKFEKEPSLAFRDRFIVVNKDGLHEFYTVESTPRKIGTAYRYAMEFINEVTAVAEPDSVIKLIDTEGNVTLRLDKINGKDVERITDAKDDMFIFTDETESKGCINTKGEVLIPAEYEYLSLLGNGYVLGQPKKLLSGGVQRSPYWIMNLKGEKLGEVDMMKYDRVGYELIDGKYLAVNHYENEKPSCGLVGIDGSVKLPLTTAIAEIKDSRKDMFVFSNGEQFGLMNVEGKVLIPAKYKQLYFMSDDRLMAFGADDKGKIIDLEDNQIGGYGNYSYPYLESRYYGKRAAVPLSDTVWTFVDKDGKETSQKHWYNVGGMDPFCLVENDYFNPEELLHWLKVTANGVDGLTFSSESEEVQARETDIFYDNIGKTTGFRKKYRHCDIWVRIYMSGNLQARRGGVWKHTNATPVCFEINILDDDRCPFESQWKGFTAVARELGKEKVEVDGPFEVYRVNEDTYAVVERRFGTSVFFYLCKASALQYVLTQKLYYYE